MASIMAAQVMAWPVSARSWAAASRALTFLVFLGLVAAPFAGAVSVAAACLEALAAFDVLERLRPGARFGVLSAAALCRCSGGLVPLAEGV